jgi:hypothetical protein
VQSCIGPCIFTRGQTLYALYTDDSILASPSEKEIDKIMEDMRAIGLDITDKGDVSDFLGVNIEKKIGPDGQPTIHLTQPHLINSILKDLQWITKLRVQSQLPCQAQESHTGIQAPSPSTGTSIIGVWSADWSTYWLVQGQSLHIRCTSALDFRRIQR